MGYDWRPRDLTTYQPNGILCLSQMVLIVTAKAQMSDQKPMFCSFFVYSGA